MRIGNKRVGEGRTFIIAEAGINHNGRTDLAKQLVLAARDAGADAVKFQSFKAEWMCDSSLRETKEVAGVTGGSQSSYDMYKALELSDDAHREVFEFAREHEMLCFSSVFDPRTLPLLMELDVPALKIASGDLTYTPLLIAARDTGKPILLSSGMATLAEVQESATHFLNSMDQLCLMHCVSEYPTPPVSANLKVLQAWSKLFACPIGFSDHSVGIVLAPVAVALGASVIEKHFTLDCAMEGPDQSLSCDPQQFGAMVDAIRQVEEALGDSEKKPTPLEQSGRMDGRRGIKTVRMMQSGEKIQAADLQVIKPATGLPPVCFDQLIGKTLQQDLKAGTPLEWQHLQ